MASTARHVTPATSQLVTYARWIAEDPLRGDLPQAEAWRLFSGGAPAPSLPHPPVMPAPPPPPVRMVPARPKPAPVPRIRKPPVRSLPEAPLRPITPRLASVVSRYERGRFVEVFRFTDPDEWQVRCTWHGQTRRAATFSDALDLLDTWRCGVCQTIH